MRSPIFARFYKCEVVSPCIGLVSRVKIIFLDVEVFAWVQMSLGVDAFVRATPFCPFSS